MADLGWLGVAIPEEHGGSGGTYVDQTIFFEEIYRGLVPIEAIGPSTTVAGCYKRFGSEEQKADALSQIANGTVMAISISEPEAGSDVAAISCSARPGDGGYVINGQKTWCSYAHIAGRILLVARTSKEEARHHGLSILEVPGDAEGITTHKIPTMGGDEVNDVFFTDTFVPEAAIVGEVGRGFQQIMAGLDGERLLAAAVGLGIAQRALDDLLAYVTERKQFGRPIGTFQALKHRIADLAIELECARLITYDVAERLEAGSIIGDDAAHLDGQGQGDRDRQEDHARGHADDGRLRLRERVRHGVARPPRAGAADLRRDQRGPARDHLRLTRPAVNIPTSAGGITRKPDLRWLRRDNEVIVVKAMGL